MANGMPVILIDRDTDQPFPYPGVFKASSYNYVGADSIGGFGSVLKTYGAMLGVRGATLQPIPGDTQGLQVNNSPSTTAPGLLQHSRMSSADINAQVIKAAPGKVYGFQIFNNTASAKFVRLYDKASAPVPANDSALIRRRLIVPANGIVTFHVGPGLDGFAAGIAYLATGAAGDTDATALAVNDLVINVDYF